MQTLWNNKRKKLASTKAVTIYLQATNDEQFPRIRKYLYGLMKVHAHTGIHRHTHYAVISYSFCTAKAATFRKWKKKGKEKRDKKWVMPGDGQVYGTAKSKTSSKGYGGTPLIPPPTKK